MPNCKSIYCVYSFPRKKYKYNLFSQIPKAKSLLNEVPCSKRSFTYLSDSSSLLEELLSLLSELFDLDRPFRNSFRDPVSGGLLAFSSVFLSFALSLASFERSGDRFPSLERSTDDLCSLDLDLRFFDLDLRSLSRRSLERSRLLGLSREEDLSYLLDRSRPSGERRRLSRRSADRRLSRLSDDRLLRSSDLLRRLSPGLGDLRRYLAGLLRGGLSKNYYIYMRWKIVKKISETLWKHDENCNDSFLCLNTV